MMKPSPLAMGAPSDERPKARVPANAGGNQSLPDRLRNLQEELEAGQALLQSMGDRLERHRAECERLETALRTRDTSEKKFRADKAHFARQSRRFDTILRAHPDLLFELDDNFIIVEYLSALSGKLYVAPEDFLGKSIKDILPPDLGTRFEAHLAAHADAGAGAAVLEYALDVPDGHCWFEARTIRTENRYLVIIRDVTQRKELELDNRRMLKDLTASNAELNDFAYLASHDLQEPIRAISMFSRLLMDTHANQLDETGQRYLNFIAEGGDRMRALIQDLLAYSRLGAAGNDETSVAVKDIVRAVTEDLKANIDESEAHIDCAEMPVVRGDPTHLRQVFQNLIANAIKFRADQPPEISITATHDGTGWTFRISDNGIGIPAEHFKTIFEMFQRLHSAEDYAGTGIGLSLVKKIIDRRGGAVTVESELGQGSTVQFTWPDDPPPKAQHSATETPQT